MMTDALDKLGELVVKACRIIAHQRDKSAVNWARHSYFMGTAPQSHYVNACIRYYLKWEKNYETN